MLTENEPPLEMLWTSVASALNLISPSARRSTVQSSPDQVTVQCFEPLSESTLMFCILARAPQTLSSAAGPSGGPGGAGGARAGGAGCGADDGAAGASGGKPLASGGCAASGGSGT